MNEWNGTAGFDTEGTELWKADLEFESSELKIIHI